MQMVTSTDLPSLQIPTATASVTQSALSAYAKVQGGLGARSEFFFPIIKDFKHELLHEYSFL
jgi:hypothetical protein